MKDNYQNTQSLLEQKGFRVIPHKDEDGNCLGLEIQTSPFFADRNKIILEQILGRKEFTISRIKHYLLVTKKN